MCKCVSVSVSVWLLASHRHPRPRPHPLLHSPSIPFHLCRTFASISALTVLFWGFSFFLLCACLWRVPSPSSDFLSRPSAPPSRFAVTSHAAFFACGPARRRFSPRQNKKDEKRKNGQKNASLFSSFWSTRDTSPAPPPPHIHTRARNREVSRTHTCFEPSATCCAHALSSPPPSAPSRECCCSFFYISMLLTTHECAYVCVWLFSFHVCFFLWHCCVALGCLASPHLPSGLPHLIPFPLHLADLISISSAPRRAREVQAKLKNVWTTWPPCSPLMFFLCVSVVSLFPSLPIGAFPLVEHPCRQDSSNEKLTRQHALGGAPARCSVRA